MWWSICHTCFLVVLTIKEIAWLEAISRLRCFSSSVSQPNRFWKQALPSSKIWYLLVSLSNMACNPHRYGEVICRRFTTSSAAAQAAAGARRSCRRRRGGGRREGSWRCSNRWTSSTISHSVETETIQKIIRKLCTFLPLAVDVEGNVSPLPLFSK